jgi:hypothetical protein
MDVALMTDKEIREEIRRLKAVLLDRRGLQRRRLQEAEVERGHILPFAGDRCLRCDAQFFPNGGWRGEDCATRLLRAVERMTNDGSIPASEESLYLCNCPCECGGKYRNPKESVCMVCRANPNCIELREAN